MTALNDLLNRMERLNELNKTGDSEAAVDFYTESANKMETLLKIIKVQNECLQEYANGTDYYDRVDEAERCIKKVESLAKETR
jgi:hypothetical protein